jgi:NAD-dependent SIR2 family protein deacetylase
VTLAVNDLAAALARGQVIPFVGAGVSMALGLPSYAALIRELGDHVGFDGPIFEGLGDYLTLAEYYHLEKSGLLELQRHLQTKWKKSQKDVLASPVHRALVELRCRLIYTTNFDGFIEQAHRGLSHRYRTIRSAKDMVDLSDDRVHIVKLHGDLSSPSTMVFTETSYFERLSFEAPLDVKLRADALGKSLLFIGYSLSDINIRYLLFRLQRQWEKEVHPELRPKAYVYMGRPNAVQSKVLRSRGVEPIVAGTPNESASLSDFLTGLRRRADELTPLVADSSTKK